MMDIFPGASGNPNNYTYWISVFGLH